MPTSALTATVRVRYRWPFRIWYRLAAFCAHRGWVDTTGWFAERAMRHVELYTVDGYNLTQDMQRKRRAR